MNPKRFAASLLLTLFLAVAALADTHVWIGNAQAIPQIDTISVTGVWAEDDTSSITCNSKTVTITHGTAFSKTDVAAAIAAAINSRDRTGQDNDLVSDESKKIGGQVYPEFREFEAEVSQDDPNKVILTATTDGLPFTVTVAETTGGTGAIAIANTQAATGPEFADNEDIWDLGAIPVNGDTAAFVQGSVNCSHALTSFADSAAEVAVRVDPGYSGMIGLTHWNPAGYVEYRATALKSLSNGIFMVDGTTGQQGQAQLRIELASTHDNIWIEDAGGSIERPGLMLFGDPNTLADITIQKGFVEIQPDNNVGLDGPLEINSLYIGSRSLDDSETHVTIGNVNWSTTGITFDQFSGTAVCNASLHPAPEYATLDVYGGRFIYNGSTAGSGPANAVTVRNGGEFRWVTQGTAHALHDVHSGGIYDLSHGRPNTFYSVGLTAHGGATIRLGGNTPTITYDGCESSQVNLED